MRISKIVYLCFALFSVMNVLLLDLNIFGVNLRYLFFLSTVLIVFYFNQKYSILSNKNFIFYQRILVISALLFIYSFFIKGNPLSNITWFLFPYMVFLLIPVFNFLYDKFGVKSVIKLFIFHVTFLSFYFVLISLLLIYIPNLAVYITENHELSKIGIQENGIPRIFLKTCSFFIPLFVYPIIYVENVVLKAMFALIVLLQITSLFTYGLFLGIGVAIVLLLVFYRKWLVFTGSLVLFLLALPNILLNLGNVLTKSKFYSIETKISQLNKGFSHDSMLTYLFGNGVGASIVGLDDRQLKDDFVIEVAPVMLFQVGGFIFSLLILYVYGWYPFKAFLVSFKLKNRDMAFLGISQIGIIFASFTNPYVWSGGMGIFLVAMIVSLMHRNSVNQIK